MRTSIYGGSLTKPFRTILWWTRALWTTRSWPQELEGTSTCKYMRFCCSAIVAASDVGPLLVLLLYRCIAAPVDVAADALPLPMPRMLPLMLCRCSYRHRCGYVFQCRCLCDFPIIVKV